MLRTYFMFKGQYLKTAMEYTFNFWMMAIAGVLMRTAMMGVAYVLFRNVPDIAGWLEGEVYLLMSFMFISEGLCNLLFDGIWHIPALVHTGKLDVMLARPVSPLYQVLSYEIGLQGVGVVALGLVSMGMALHSLGWMTLLHVLLCLLFIVTATLVRASTYLIGACHVFWLNAGGQANVTFLIYSVGEYAKYPLRIYPAWMQALLLFVIPFGFIGYVPAMIFRGESAALWFVLLLAASLLYALLARFVFYRGIRRYESMGM